MVPLNDCVASLVSLITSQLAAARLEAAAAAAAAAAAEPEPQAGGAGAGSMSEQVSGLLQRLSLESWGPQLLALGAEQLCHLQALEDADLQELGMPLLHRRTLMRALGKQKPAGGAAAGGAAGRSAVVDDSEVGGAALVRAGSAMAASSARWEFKDGRWKPLSSDASAALEAAHAASQPTVTLTHRQWT